MKAKKYLKGGQVKLDANKDGKITGEDFKMLKGKKMMGGGKMPMYKMGGKVTDPRKKYSKMPQTPQEMKEFKDMMWAKKNEISPSAPVGGEAQRTRYEERFMQLRDRFSKGGMMKYSKGGKMKK